MSQLGDAEIIIVGGGAVGCGVAYSLAKTGKTDLLLLEREPTLAAMTTSQAAGLVGQVRASAERIRLAMWSVRTFSELQRDAAAGPNFRQVGSLRVALTDERVAEFRRLEVLCRECGLDVEFIDRPAAAAQWPAMNFDQARAILWCPSDGYLQPSDLTMSYAAQARMLGARFVTNTAVTGVILENGRVAGVRTARGDVRCGTVINAAGAHAYQLACAAGLRLPIVPVRHHYFVTVHAENVTPNLPVVRIPDKTLYVRAEVNSLLIGGWEENCLSHDPRPLALDGDTPRLEDDWDVMAWIGQQASPLVPQVERLGIRSVFKGWPTFTPDGRFIIGESRQVPGLVMAGGCNAHGVSGSAGIGRHVVESMLDPNPSEYVRSLSPDRFAEGTWDWETARRDAEQVFRNYYAISPHYS